MKLANFFKIKENDLLIFWLSDKLGHEVGHSIYPEMKETFDMLVIRKAVEFSAYKQFIFKVETRDKPDGTVNLHVGSAPADKIKKY